MKKLQRVFTSCVFVAVALMFAGCASKDGGASNEIKANSNKENGVVVNPTRVEILDWSYRAMGSPAQPEWLQPLVMYTNADAFKKVSGVDADRIVKYSHFTGKSETQALNLALGEMAYSLASELSMSILGKLEVGTGTKNQDEMNALRNYAVRVRADISGVREEYRFWQKSRTFDTVTNERSEPYYEYYVVYSLSKDAWDKFVRSYMANLVGDMIEGGVDESFVREVGALTSQLQEESDRKDRQQAEKELAAARAYIAQADAEAAKANQATAEASLAAKKLSAAEEEKVQAAQTARELMYASFLQ